MTRVAPRVPEPTDLLCERCGYVLNGLPTDSKCPECGTPIVESIGTHRVRPAWEKRSGRFMQFWITTAAVIISPAHFYRTLEVNGSVDDAKRFSRWHVVLASLLFSAAATGHAWWYARDIYSLRVSPTAARTYLCAGFIAFGILCYAGLAGITYVAARLTTWEATYRGYRLPVRVVLRGLYYHSAHYLPVAASAAAVVCGYQFLLQSQRLTGESAINYLYVLSGLVVVAAGYLFATYWTGMRNMMYANR